MQKYIRTHIVEAEPMTRGEHLKSKGLKLIPGTGSESDEGYFIQYPDGYKSWCPKASFEASGRPIDGMTFGQAIEAMKQGKKVSRKGWNGKGMYIWVMPGSTVKGCNQIVDPHLAEIDKTEGEIRFLGSVRMRTATGDVLTGWLASQTDMLSEDWTIVD
jgi:hypothetical protein